MLPAMSLGDYVDTYTSELYRAQKPGAKFRTKTIDELTVFLVASVATYVVIRYAADDEDDREELMDAFYEALGKVFIEYMVLTILQGVYHAAKE